MTYFAFEYCKFVSLQWDVVHYVHVYIHCVLLGDSNGAIRQSYFVDEFCFVEGN